MYMIDIYLGQEIDGDITVSTEDVALLQVTVYDGNGDDWPSYDEAFLIVKRLGVLGDSVVIEEEDETTPLGDNVMYFQLIPPQPDDADSVTSFPVGDYLVFLYVTETDYSVATPVTSSYSFKPFHFKVVS